ncbi:nuclear transport factor 2 family protein [Nocardia pseudovaccinii]|uniref:nuclear transport factor 2 family protein n=1 Tax=Nocardia pseudovaccinii TaxID=189540 RepID=UPI0007A3BB50|nr:nuclear transport factor 2 family protein [Nocardia pseudovaccinii]
MTSALTAAALQAVDSLDAKGFAEYFAPDGKITFGNVPALEGRNAVEAGCAGFFGTIGGMQHDIVNEWVVGKDTIVELAVTYTRKDGRKVSIPVVSIWTVGGTGLIDEYRVFFDLAPVFA